MTNAVEVVTLLIEEAMANNKKYHLFEDLHTLVAALLRVTLPDVTINHTETCGQWHTGRTRFGRWIPGKLFIKIISSTQKINLQKLQEDLATLFEVSFCIEVGE